jgi:DNA-binding FadR family transcriptional regulator
MKLRKGYYITSLFTQANYIFHLAIAKMSTKDIWINFALGIEDAQKFPEQLFIGFGMNVAPS